MEQAIMSYLYLAVLFGCATPESSAERVAVAYIHTANQGFDQETEERLGAMVCPEDREAHAESRAEMARVLAGERMEQPEVKLKTTTLAPDGQSAEVTMELTRDEEPEPQVLTKKLRKIGDSWCVMTGAGEERRRANAAKEVEQLRELASSKTEAWDFDGARAALAEAREKLSILEADRAARLAQGLDTAERSLTLKSEGWVGGRWSVTSDTDPMSDRKDLFVRLVSTKGVPNVLGEEKPASVLIRCKSNALEMYVSTQSLLGADSPGSSVSGRSRFGTEPATAWQGVRSEDSHAVFLRQPRDWMAKLVAHEGSTWSLEIPLLRRAPAVATFELAGASKALENIPADCKP